MADLFTPVVADERLSEDFRTVAFERGYASARAAFREVFAAMGERDPHFVEQFQTTGFNARVSELYLFAALVSAGLTVTFEGDAPDFLISGNGADWALEATTANPSGGAVSPELPDDRAELQAYIDGELAVRLGSALFSKLQKAYWALPHVRDKPLVFAIQNFASEDSLQLADTALVDYLYGRRTFAERTADGSLAVYSGEIEKHVGTKEIPSNFFGLPEATNISAVLWTNSGTVAKFSRMGFQRGLDSAGILMKRVGLRAVLNPDADAPAPFSYDVGSRWESWEEGLVMAHNPCAKRPLPQASFPGIVHHELGADGRIITTFPPFHAYTSKTLTVVGI